MLLALLLTLTSDPGRLAVIENAPPFALMSQDEQTLRATDLRGKVLLVGFVFTTCNGSCPATTHRMAQVQQLLKDRGLLKEGRVQLLSITLDPARDTPEALRKYAKLYDVDLTSWSFLTGQPELVAAVTKAWRMWTTPAANGQLDHPSRVFLVDARGRIREIYNLDFLKAAWVVEDIAELLREEAKP